jgi:hypothetical protein
MEFLKLYNVRFVMPEERKTENMLERIFFNVVQVQNQLIANRLKDNTEVFGKIAQLRNELKNDFRDSWSQKIADLLAQFASYSEQIVAGYDDLKNEIVMLRGQIKDQHTEIM